MSYPITLSEVKEHLRIDPDDFDNDHYIESLVIPTAVEHCNMFVDASAMSYMTDVSCPYMVKQAMLITCADLYDVNRSSYTLGSIKREDIIQRLLLPYKTIYW